MLVKIWTEKQFRGPGCIGNRDNPIWYNKTDLQLLESIVDIGSA